MRHHHTSETDTHKNRTKTISVGMDVEGKESFHTDRGNIYFLGHNIGTCQKEKELNFHGFSNPTS